MTKIIICIWILIGIGVVVYGIKMKKLYGYISQFNITNLIIMIVSVIVWPYTLLSIIKLHKRDEAIINKVLKENPKYTRENLLRGAKIWNDMRSWKWPPKN